MYSFIDDNWLKPLLKKLLALHNKRDEEIRRIADTFGDPELVAKYYIPPNCQHHNPADYDERESGRSIVHASAFELINDFFKGEFLERDGRTQMFILSDAGMGKTSLLMMLKLAHLTAFWPPGYECLLLKLGKDTMDAIKAIENRTNTVLLLDALDEDTTAWGRIKERMQELLRETRFFHRVIISCRTQFFPENELDPFENAGRVVLKDFRCPILYLPLFGEKQVDAYLKRKFPIRWYHFTPQKNKAEKQRIRACAILDKAGSLRLRPMLLAHIDDLLNAGNQLQDTYKIYTALVNVWLLREQRKFRRIHETTKKVPDNKTLLKVCVRVAAFMQARGERKIEESELNELIFADPDISWLLEFEVGGRSLLNRDSQRAFRFSHHTIQEYLIAHGIINGYLDEESISVTDGISRFLSHSGYSGFLSHSGYSRIDLTVELPEQIIKTGKQILLVEIHNQTKTPVKNITLLVEKYEGLHIRNKKHEIQALVCGESEQIEIHLESEHPKNYILEGRVIAEDPGGHETEEKFSFYLDIGRAGNPYKPPKYAPYEAGEGLSSERTFSGREELLYNLRAFWKQPGGKPAVLFLGQRRIGKTTLLNKITRDGLAECKLLPVYVSVQNCGDEYDLLSEISRKMAIALNLGEPHLDRQYPRPDFKSFVSGLKKTLLKRRFLLILDEAEELFLAGEKNFGTFPGFLRGMMQDADYPVLVLLCGAYVLRQMGREYDSRIFNTMHEFTVSYMSRAESDEVLQKPARGILEFDPLALSEAYNLTYGQPLLLQLLGDVLIRQFNAMAAAKKTRGDYVDYNDLKQAAKELTKQHNPVFQQHWQDSDHSTRQVLSAMACVEDKQLDVGAISDALQKNRLSLNQGVLFQVLHQLTEEEIFISEGAGYCYAVPLYRRWVAWNNHPDKVWEDVAIAA